MVYFSYDYDEGAYERICQYQVFQAGVDIDKLNVNWANKSTWLIIDIRNGRGGATHAVISSRDAPDLTFVSCIFGQNVYKAIAVSNTPVEGTPTVGYWSRWEQFISVHDSLQNGNKFMTLDEYNAANRTNYRWE